MTQIVKLRVERGIRQAAQERNDAIKFRITPAVSLREMKRGMVIPGVGWRELNSPAKKEAEKVQTRFCGEKCVSRQDLRSVEGQGTVAERFFEFERWRKRHASQP